MKHLAKFLKNRIWFIAAAVLLVLLAVQGCGKLYEPAMALEQLARCGETEHVHTEECYMDELLICGTRAHTHGENCYIFRVDENDLNAILTDMGEKEIYSLEDYMAHTLSSVYGEGVSLDDILRHTSVEELNAAIAASGDSKLRFNAAMDLPATYALGDAVDNRNNYLNLFIRLDGTITCIGSYKFSDTSNSRSIATSTIVGAYNSDSVISRVTTSNIGTTGYYIRYNTNQSTTYFGSRASSGGDGMQFGNTSSAQYAILSTSRSSTTPMEFYSLTLDYTTYGAGASDSKKAIQHNMDYTLPNPGESNYWTDAAGNEITQITDISQATTVYARPKNYTVTFDLNYEGGGVHFTQEGITPGSTITAPPVPERIGYVFGGWYTDSDCTDNTKFIFETGKINKNLTLYAKWTQKTYNVTFKDIHGGIIDTKKIGHGDSVIMPAGYIWETDDNVYTAGSSVAIYGDTTFIGTPTYSVAFDTKGGSAVPVQTVISGGTATRPADPTKIGHSFLGWYLGNDPYDFSTPVYANITLTAGWKADSCIITYRDGETTRQEAVDYGTELSLPEPQNGTYWQLEGGGVYSPGDKLTVTGNMTFTSTDKVTATYIYKNGNVTTSNPVTPGTEITLPTLTGGNVWMDEEGNVYQSGAKVTISKNTEFTEKYSLKVTYNVNFSSSGLTSNTPPTIIENGSSSATITIYEGQRTTLYSVNPRVFISGNSGEAAYFTGWVPSTDSSASLPPGAALSYDVLSQYARNGTVTLNGNWHRDSTNNYTDVRFYVRFDSIPPDFGGNVGNQGTNFYTGQVYHAYAGNSPGSGFSITDKTADNSYTADKTIRTLVGNKGDGELWISGVPDDAWLFEQLKTYTRENQTSAEIREEKYLRVYVGEDANGNDIFEDVLASELDTSHYAMRWYVFKKENDGWHIDGRLVKKQGQITIDKVFGGNHDAFEQVVGSFYILAENGTMQNGTFSPYAVNDRNYNAYVLVRKDIEQSALNEIKATYPNATIQYYNTQTDINGEITDHWLVENVTLGEYWRFTEFVEQPTYEVAGTTRNYSWYAEYTITDTDGTQSAIAEFGSRAQVIGKTYALDEDADQGLDIEFTNYYYDSDSILIRKIDGDTGEPLGGAEFQLWQPVSQGSSSVQLKFTETEAGIYSVDPNGTIDSIITNSEGFSVITIQDFSYESGPLTVKEVTAPTGYAVVNDINLGYLDEAHTKAGIISIVGADASEFDYHAEYHDENGGVLVVKDHAASYTNVSATKKWEGSMTADRVTLVLQATVDGVTQNAGALFPTLVGHEVVLDANGGYPATNGTPNYTSTTPWTYYWTDLPAYANGKPVSWSVKETKVGGEITMVDSDQFANWIVTYSTGSVDDNGDGVADHWSNTVTNTQRRTMLYVSKTNESGTVPLSDAKFRLVEVEWDAKTGSYISKGVAMDHVTDETGYTAFDGLAAGALYALTETEAPPGYILATGETILSIDGMGVVYGVKDGVRDSAPLSTEYVSYANNYVVRVINTSTPAFPNTGGEGTDVYTRLGALLMLAAAAAVIYKTKRRREGDASAV